MSLRKLQKGNYKTENILRQIKMRTQHTKPMGYNRSVTREKLIAVNTYIQKKKDLESIT